jgi:hypothetical protein
MANKISTLVALVLALSLGAIIHSFTTIPKGYAAPNSPGTFQQALQHYQDKNVVLMRRIDTGGSEEVAQGKLSDVGEDFIMVLQPVRSSIDKFNTQFIPFTSIQRTEKLDHGGVFIWIR